MESKYIIGNWYYYEDLKFQIKEVLKDRVIVDCPNDLDFKFFLYGTWVDVGCVTEEEEKERVKDLDEEE